MDTLQQLREKIDRIDIQMIDLLAQRFSTAVDIGAYKKAHKLPSLDRVRWKQVLQSNVSRGRGKQLSEKFIIDLRELVHKETLQIQQ